MEDCQDRSPEFPVLSQKEKISEEACPRLLPQKTEKDGSPKLSPRRKGVVGVSRRNEQTQPTLQNDEGVIADSEQTSGKARGSTENDKGSDVPSSGVSLPRSKKHGAGVKDSKVEVATAPATGRAVLQRVKHETSEQAKKHYDLRGKRLDNVVAESNASGSIPQTKQQQSSQGSSSSADDKTYGAEAIQDGGPKLGVDSSGGVEPSYSTREPSEQIKHETPLGVKRKKKKKHKHSKEKDERKETDGDETTTDSLASGPRSGDNTTPFLANQAQISAAESTKLSTVTLPDCISSPIDNACPTLQSTATNQPIFPSVPAPSRLKSEHRELAPETGKSLKLRGTKKHVSSESDASPAKLPMKKQKLSGSSPASTSKDLFKTLPSAGNDGVQRDSTGTDGMLENLVAFPI